MAEVVGLEGGVVEQVEGAVGSGLHLQVTQRFQQELVQWGVIVVV
jgi:hypothetical protein